MRVELKLSDDTDAYVIKNLWPLYVHDLSPYAGTAPNRHGLLSDDDAIKTLAEQGESQNAWWSRPDALFPYLILADGCPAGFNLIATHPFLPEGIDTDFVVHEFFVVPAYRGRGVAERAACAGFDRHGPRWEVVTYPGHPRARAFWRKAIGHYTADRFCQTEGDHPWGRRIIFTFAKD